MFLFGLIGLVMPLLGLVLIAWAVLTIWRTVTLPRNTPREPVCEHCSYPVAGHIGVAGFTCPECGSDLLKVGITTPRMEATRRGSLAAALLAWTFLFGVGGYIALMVGLMFTSFSSARAITGPATTTYTQTLTPITALYNSIDLEYESDWQSITSTIDIGLTLTDGSEHALLLDPGPMTVVGLSGGQTPWSNDTIDAWFGEVGLDMSDAQIVASAREVSRVVDITIMSPGNAYSLNLTEHTNGFATTAFAAPTPVPAQGPFFGAIGGLLAGVAVAGLVYVLGIVLIVRRRRRLLRQFTSTPTPPAPPPSST